MSMELSVGLAGLLKSVNIGSAKMNNTLNPPSGYATDIDTYNRKLIKKKNAYVLNF